MKLAASCLVSILLLVGCNSSSSSNRAEPEPVSTTTTFEVSTVTPKVIWPDLPKDDRALASLGADKSRVAELLLQAPVPVYAPTNVTLEKPTFVVRKEFWSLTGRVNGTTIAIQGTRAAHRYEDIAPAVGNRSLRGGIKGFISINEGIRTASWIENGVAYSLDVECADPTDARCTEEGFTLDLVEHLGFAGGSAH